MAEGVKKRPTIRDLKEVPLAVGDEKKTESQEDQLDGFGDAGDGVRVPGTIPEDVRALSSSNPGGLVPRYTNAFKELIESRGDCKILRLAFKQVGDEGAGELGSLLKTGTCKNLEGLDLSCNNISKLGATQIGRALTSNTKLMYLDISTNDIRDEGIAEIATALKLNSTLTYLDAHACGISDQGARSIAEAIENNFVIAVVNLKANYIRDEGAICLARASRKSSSMRCLITASNDIGLSGTKALEDAMYDNDRLVDFVDYDLRMPNS